MPVYEHDWNPPDLPHQVREGLNKVIDYLWDDELNHLRAAVAEKYAAENPTGTFRDHIFAHLVYLKAWLEARNLRPEWYVEDLIPRASAQTRRNHPLVKGTAPRVPIDMKLIEPQLIQDLLNAAHEAADVMSETLNLDLAVGNDQSEDVKNLTVTLDRLSGVLDRFRDRASS